MTTGDKTLDFKAIGETLTQLSELCLAIKSTLSAAYNEVPCDAESLGGNLQLAQAGVDAIYNKAAELSDDFFTALNSRERESK
jgi:hypothetical protein